MYRLADIRRLTIILMLSFAIGFLPNLAHADILYQSYVKDSFGYEVPVQPPYKPMNWFGEFSSASSESSEVSTLRNPSDIYIDHLDYIYVADTGNNRIVVYQPNGTFERELIPEGDSFKQPQGVFVTNGGRDIYVADTGNQRVVKMNQDGEVSQIIIRPDTPFIPGTYRFDPIKIVVDKRGYMYIVTMGGYQGLLQLNPDGDFVSFFGGNVIQSSNLEKIMNQIKTLVYSDEMKERELSQLPGSIENVEIDERGFIYTVSRGNAVINQQVKKLNIKGVNMVAKSDEYEVSRGISNFSLSQPNRSFGEYTLRQHLNMPVSNRQTQLVDVAIDSNGNMAVIDLNYKNISFYDSEGNSLFFWSGRSDPGITQLGLLRAPIAVAFNSKDDLYILDNQDNRITRYVISNFGRLIIDASAYTADGRYEESKSLWEEVLHYNSAYPPALIGLARAEYQENRFKEASVLFKKGFNQYDYSNAFWQLRLEWMQKHFSTLATFVVIGLLLLSIGAKLSKRYKRRAHLGAVKMKRLDVPLLQQLRHAFTILRYPMDGFTALRFESKGSYPSAIILLAISAASYVIIQYYTSFSFNKMDRELYRMLPDLLMFLAIWLLWVVCNYFTSSILQGEARFRDVFISSAYALIPLSLLGLPITVVSNVMSLSELAIYQFMYVGMLAWIGFLFIASVQALQNYFVGEAISNVLITLFSMAMMVVLAFLIYSLTNQTISFLMSIYREVLLR